MSVFDEYAAYYDLLYRDKDYAAEAAFIAEHLERFGAQHVLDLGAGTGAHAALLAERGLHVTGVDVSHEMLARAAGRREQLAPALREALRFKHGDARSVRVAGKFDAVISLFHVLSYQQTNADVRAMLATAVAHLPVGAPFLFDFWYGPAVLVQRPETRVKMLEDERILVTRIARSVLRENDDLVEVHYDILVEEKSSRVTRRIEETHVMRYFFLPELDLLLEGAGLRRVHATEWAGEGPLSHRSWGGFAIAQKVAD